MIKLKIFLTVIFLSITTSSCTLFNRLHIFTPEYTKEQCDVVSKNFYKLKIGMTKEEVIPLIGGERKSTVYRNIGLFPEQKTQWEIWPLCYDPESCKNNSEKKQCYEWQMIAFDTQTGKVVKIFSGDPELIGFF